MIPQWVVDGVYGCLHAADGVMCELGIPYAINGGTLLGAVRHAGLIPWDDDADLAVHVRQVPRLLAARGALNRIGYDISGMNYGLKIFPSRGVSLPAQLRVLDADTASSLPFPSCGDWDFKYPWVDLFVYDVQDGRLVSTIPKARRRWPGDYFLKEDMERLQRRRFGPLSLLSVADSAAHDYLDRLFGPNWPRVATVSPHHLDRTRPMQRLAIGEFTAAVPTAGFEGGGQ